MKQEQFVIIEQADENLEKMWARLDGTYQIDSDN